MFSSPSLDRSPSLSSNSSGASSAGSLAPITPALQSSSTFASPRIDEVDEFGSSTPMKAMVSAGGGGRPLTKVSTTSPWSAGHRTGGGTKSFDAARSLFANKEKDSIAGGGGAVRAPSPTLRGSPFARPSDSLNASSPGSNASPWARAGSPVRSTSPFKLQELGSSGRSSPTPSSVPFPPSSPTRLSSSPTRFGASTSPTRPPLPTIPSDRATSSPSHRASPSFSASSSPNPNPLNQSQRERVLSSAIFSTRDRPSSPALGGSPDFGSATGGGGGGSPGMQRMGSLAGRAGGMGHKRAMTLPQLGLGANGLPVPMMRGEEQGGERGVGLGLGKKMQSLVIEEDVPGLPGRARLSRPASSASPFAPSAVFNSSHGLSSSASTPHSLSTSTSPSSPPKQRVPQAPQRAQTLLPSQTVKAMDNQRKDLVAYEYLCHLAEARDWLTSHISTSTAPLSELCGETINDFEQSLRNGYALAHLARSLGGERCKGPIYNDPTRHFRHTVNINIFFNLVDEVGLPEIFRFETVDLYDAKNLPKVVYCIHALSYLMARQGLTGQMADLVGKVDFTDAEVGAAQKGLNDAGVRMPDFGGLAKALNRHESVAETDEQRQHRELLAATHGVVALQSHARGALARRAFAARVQQQRALERQRAKAKAEEAQRVRAEEERRRVEEAEEAKRVQAEEEAERRRAAEEAERRRVAEEQERLRLAEEAERRRIAEEEERQRLADEEEERQYQAAVLEAARTMVGFQASARGALLRRRFYDTIEQLSVQHRSVVGFQAAARAALVRRQLERKRVAFSDSSASIVGFQAVCRSVLARQALLDRIQELRSAESFIVGVQSHIRGLLSRQTFAAKARDLRKTEVVRSVGGLQSLARAALTRRRLNTQRQALGFVEPDVVGIQAQTRGFLARRNFLEWRDNVYRNEDAVIYLQSVLRGVLARRKYYNLHRHFHENLASVVRMQAAIRSRRQGSQYRQLKVGKNVPVGTIKNFMRLLDDSEFDYRGELQLESLRKELVSAIRETQDLEDDVKDLDTKIALLVKNKITHEVARAQRAGSSRGLAPQTRSNLLSAANDPFAGGALDRTTQHKLDMYQQLFWHLQTKPQYLARLFANTARLGISDKVQKAIEATTFVVFGYAQGHREEFLLLKLLQCSLQEEISHLPDAGAFVRGQFTFIRLLTQYGRGVSQRQYLTGTLGPEVKAVMQRQGLDLGTDPITIYRADIAREEEHTGLPSQRPKDVELKQAVADKATNEAFIAHLLSLRQATSSFLQAIIGSTRTMPFGIRYIAREVFRALRAQFSQQSEADALRVAGHLVYYRFLQPAILAPETYGIVESVISPIQRKNLAEVCKMLNQISVGRVFGEEQPYLKPMNQFLATSSAQFTRWIYDIINVENAETHFRADEYIDAAAARRPVIYISPNDIYSTHSVLAEHIDVIAPEEDDPVRKVIYELGGAPSGSSAELSRARVDEIALTLATRLSPQEDPNAGNKHLFNQAKRRVLSILKIHHGNDLEAVLARQVTEDDEDAWAQAVEEEEIEERRRAHEERRPVVLQLDDIRNMSFAQLKMATLGDIVQLRKLGLVKREDKYQAILDAIARDIHMKHHRRVQRTNELQTMHATLTSLKDKKRYLDDQIKSYHLYIDQSMAGIQKKSNKRLVLPWSLQASHERSLEKSGKRYKFGSYKYSARKLYDRGVLLSIDQHSPKQFSKISLVISSNDVGVFEVKAEFLGMPATTVELKLEDLLESQFVGKQTINIGDVAKCSIPLLLNLINRKFSE